MSRVSIAIIGLGRVSRTHIDAIRYVESCELAAVADIDEERARTAGEEFDIPYYTDTDEMFAEPTIDAVVVAVPHHLHEPLIVQACEAGKHVLVEKVMATSPQAGQSMVDAAETNDVKLMVGQSYRYFPDFRDARVRRDEIGTPINLLYTLATTLDSETAPSWWQSEEKTGGLAYPMLGSHTVDFTLWMFEPRDPVAVAASGANHNPEFEGDDDVTITIHFEDGSHATNFLTTNSNELHHNGILIGTDGGMRWEQAEWDDSRPFGTTPMEASINGTPVDADAELPHNFAIEMNEFVTAIRNDREPETDGRTVLTQLEVIAAARRAGAEDRVVKLEEIRGN